MRNLIRFMIIITSILYLSACAHKVDEKRFQSFWQEGNQAVTVAAFKAPQPQIHRVNDEGLLEFAVHNVLNKDMNKMLKNSDLSTYNDIDSSFAKCLKARKIQAEVLPMHFENSKKNREIILKQASGNKVLTLELRAIGAKRNYAGLIPMGAPEGHCVLVGRLIDPRDDAVLWVNEVEINQPVQGPWDQNPHYPNLQNAMQLAMQEAKQELLDSFFSGR